MKKKISQLTSSINEMEQIPSTPLDDLINASFPTPPSQGVYLATFVGFSETGQPLVQMHGKRDSQQALSSVDLDASLCGREVVLAIPKSASATPVIIGVIQPPVESTQSSPPQVVEVQKDNEKLVLTADREIVLQCGEASITLTKAGKVLIRGNYVLTRSSGANHIKGGSVQIN